METKLEATNDEITKGTTSCPTEGCQSGGCGGPGLCPGVALLLGYVVGSAVTLLSGLVWLGWVVGLPLTLILVTGAWRYLPKRPSS